MNNETPEDLTSDQNLSGHSTLNSQPSKTPFVSPPEHVWKIGSGKAAREVALWPLCNGGEIIFGQVLEPQDSNETAILIWTFIYAKQPIPLFNRNGKALATREALDAAEHFEFHIAPLARDRARFRGAFFRWLNSLPILSIEDRDSASQIFADAHGWARETAVTAVKQPGQKKTAARSRARSRS